MAKKLQAAVNLGQMPIQSCGKNFTPEVADRCKYRMLGHTYLVGLMEIRKKFIGIGMKNDQINVNVATGQL